MLNYDSRSEERLAWQDFLFTTVIHPNYVSDLELYGCDLETIQVGYELHLTAAQLNKEQIEKVGKKLSMTEDFNVLRKMVTKRYITNLTLARIAFKKNTDFIQSLELDGRRPSTYSSLVVMIENFYKILMSRDDMLATIGRFKITKASLQDNYKQFEDLKNLYRDRVTTQSDKVDLTKRRNDAMEAIDEWIGDFIEICKLAFEEAPTKLSRLGMV